MNTPSKEVTLEIVWKAADKLRGYVSSEQSLGVLLGMLFIRWISQNKENESAGRYLFRVPAGADWKSLANAQPHTFVSTLMHAVNLLERENPELQSLFTEGKLFSCLDSLGDHMIECELAHFAGELPAYQKESELDNSSESTVQIFMELIHNLALGLRHFGADFASPPSIKNLVVALTQPRSGQKIFDPLCGTGGFLVEAHQFAMEKSTGPAPMLYGWDTSSFALAIARMNLMMVGANFELYRTNILSEEWWQDSESSAGKFDIVLTNPPFSAPNTELNTRQFRRNGYLSETERLANADHAFLQYIVASVNENGRAATVAPLGALFRKGAEQKLRRRLIEKDLFETIVQLPAGLFYGTVIPACIIVINKNKPPVRRGKVQFINAANLKVEAGRIKTLPAETIQKIYEKYYSFDEVDFLSKLATLEEIAANEYDLSVNRYVRGEQLEHRPIAEIMEDIDQLQNEQTILCQDLLKLTSDFFQERPAL